MRGWWRRDGQDPSQGARRRQLDELCRLASQIATVFRANGDGRSADMYADLAEGASLLLRNGFTQSSLNELSGAMPATPSWLDPRAADFDMQREPWQVELGPVVAECRRVATELRVVGSLWRLPADLAVEPPAGAAGFARAILGLAAAGGRPDWAQPPRER